MKRLLNLGVSDPLTLGMAHPVADRLETLSCSKALTKGRRAAVLGIMGGLAILSAPFTLAADDAEHKQDIKIKFVSSEDGLVNQGFELVYEDGQEQAYTISENGERVPAQLEELEDGSKRIQLPSGQSIYLPSLSVLENLTDLTDLNKLESFNGLTEVVDLDIDWDDFNGDNLNAFVFNSVHSGEKISEEILAKLPESVQELLKNAEGSKEIKIVKTGDAGSFNFSNLNGKVFSLSDTIVEKDFDFVTNRAPLEQAFRNLEKMERQLSELAEDSTLTYDLENAMRNLEEARKSLRAAEERLEQSE